MKEGWEIKKMGEVLTIERGGSPRPIEKYITIKDMDFHVMNKENFMDLIE